MNTYMIKTAILFVLLNVTFGETNIASTKLSGPNVCQRTEEVIEYVESLGNDDGQYEERDEWKCQSNMCVFLRQLVRYGQNRKPSQQRVTRVTFHCCDGYVKNPDGNTCIPLCKDCKNGNCSASGVCTNESNKSPNTIIWDMHIVADRKTLWICVLVVAVFLTALVAFDCFCIRSVESKTNDLIPNKYAGNLVLGAVSPTKSELAANSALWTPPLDRSTSLSLPIKSRQHNPAAVHPTKKVHHGESSKNRKHESKSPVESKIPIESSDALPSRDCVDSDLPSPFEPNKSFVREYNRLNSKIAFTHNEKDLKC